MNIGILTLPLNNYNYGGIIQNFALQKVLKSLGHDVLTVNRLYDSKGSIIFKESKDFVKEVLSSVRRSGIPYTSKNKKIVAKNLIQFIEENILISRPLNSSREFYNFIKESKFDCLIAGSDQVWRPSYSPNIEEALFKNIDSGISKISYAASFGSGIQEFSPAVISMFQDQLKTFKGISLREIDAVDNLQSEFEINTQLVLDPTLLLNKDDYCSLISRNRKLFNTGIYSYVLDRSPDTTNIVENIQQSLNSQVFQCQKYAYLGKSKSMNRTDYISPSMEQWLSGFADADFVVTDSFHGTIFSIIFNKPFLSIGNKSRGMSRFNSILSILGLQDRLISNIDQITPELLNRSIDYSDVNRRIEQLKKSSIDFLKVNLS